MDLGIENKAVTEIKKYCARYNISMPELALHIDVVPIRVYEIMNGKRRVTIDTDLRLCKLFGLKNKYFLERQTDYDYEQMAERLQEKISKIKPITKKG